MVLSCHTHPPSFPLTLSSAWSPAHFSLLVNFPSTTHRPHPLTQHCESSLPTSATVSLILSLSFPSTTCTRYSQPQGVVHNFKFVLCPHLQLQTFLPFLHGILHLLPSAVLALISVSCLISHFDSSLPLFSQVFLFSFCLPHFIKSSLQSIISMPLIRLPSLGQP